MRGQLLRAIQNGDFFASLERNFIGIECTMEAQTTVSISTQCGLFIDEYKKYTLSGVTFSFKAKLRSAPLPPPGTKRTKHVARIGEISGARFLSL